MLVRVVVLALLAQVVCAKPLQKKDARIYLADLDARAAEYVAQVEQETGHNVLWYDMYGENEHLQDNPEYHQYQITVSVPSHTWGDIEDDLEKPGFTYSQWFHNGGSEPIESVFSKTTTFTDTYSWSLRTGMSCGVDTVFSIGVPGFFDASTNFSTDFTLDDETTHSQTKEEEYTIENTIIIPANRSVLAEFIITERDMVAPFTADVIVEGWIAIWFEDQWNEHYLWFHEITNMADEEFVLTNNSTLVYTQTGAFHGIRGVDTTFRVTEYPLQPNNNTLDHPSGKPLSVRYSQPAPLKHK